MKIKMEATDVVEFRLFCSWRSKHPKSSCCCVPIPPNHKISWRGCCCYEHSHDCNPSVDTKVQLIWYFIHNNTSFFAGPVPDTQFTARIDSLIFRG